MIEDVKIEDIDMIKSSKYSFYRGCELFNSGDYLRSFSILQAMLEDLYETQDFKKIAYVKNLLGCIYKKWGFYDKALEYCFEAFELSRKLYVKEVQGSVLICIGTIYKKMSNYDRALEYFRLALKQLKGFKKAKECIIVHNNIGDILRKKGTIELAFHHFNTALNICDNGYEFNTKGYTYNSLAKLFYNSSDIPSANKYFQMSNQEFRMTEDSYGLCLNLKDMSQYYIYTKEYGKAIKNLHKALKLSRNGNMSGMEVRVLKLMHTVFAQNNKYKQAYEYQSMYMNKKLEVLDFENKHKHDHMQTILKSEKNKNNIEQNMIRNQELEALHHELIYSIKERDEAHVELKANQLKYKNLFSMTDISYFRTSLDGKRIIDLNQPMATLLGFNNIEDLKNINVNILYDDIDDRNALSEKVRKLGKTKIEQLKLRTKDGKLLYVDGAIWTDDGEIIDGILIDTTHRTTIEKSYMDFINKSRIGFFIMQESKILLPNRAFANLTGYSIDELTSMSRKDLMKCVHEDDLDYCREQLTSRKSKMFPHPFRIRHKSGNIIWVEFIPTEITFGNKNAMLISAFDATMKKWIEIESNKFHKFETLSILAGGIAHDFNNLLQAVLHSLELYEIKYADLKEKQDSILKIKKALNRGTKLSRQLLTFTKEGAPAKQLADLSEIILESANFVLTGSNINCEFKISDDLWNASVDAGQISQVIQNLVINSQQAMNGIGRITIIAENTVLKQSENHKLTNSKFVKISIKDNGPGIPKDKIHKIFDPFYSTKPDGSGLGLSICNSIINKHDGHITVRSNPVKGTTFNIFLPADSDTLDSYTDDDTDLINMKGSVLMVDENNETREVLGPVLEHLGHNVYYSSEFKDVLNEIERNRDIDFIIVDASYYNKANVLELTRKTKEIAPSIKTILMSGNSEDPLVAEYKNYGFSQAVAKPVSAAEISRLLTELI